MKSLKVIEKIASNEFKLSDVYKFEEYFKKKFPNNNFVKDKIRQQLQVLRDKGILEFKWNGGHTRI